MIKANEVRVGNYFIQKNAVQRFYGGPFEIKEVVKQITGYDIKTLDDEPTCDIYHPIPLTPEWLKRCGFKYQDRDINATVPRRFYISDHFGDHKEYWLEMNMPDENWKMDTWYWWLNWDVGGGRHHVHLPNGHELRYLHQLQNLYFALTGQELTIKL